MKKKQSGISAIEGLLILVIIGIVGRAGLYVMKASKKIDDTNKITSTSQNQPAPKKTKAQIPADYISYSDADTGFSIAYPNEWGTLSKAETDASSTSMTTPALKEFKFPGDPSTAYLDGSFGIIIANKEGFSISTTKYGAGLRTTLEGNTYVWKVISVNPADETDKVGSNYSPKVVMNAVGIKMYDFANGDEGTFTSRWVLESKDKFILIYLPNLESPDSFLGGPNANTDTAAYAAVSKKVLDTIQVN